MATNAPEPDTQLQREREKFQREMARRRDDTVRAIAIGVLAVGAFTIFFSLWLAINNPEGYKNAKDILLFVNPFLGVVIGYYFQKAANDSRAETAENAALTANESAQQAQTERQTAQGQLQTTREYMTAQRDALHDLAAAAQAITAEPGGVSDADSALGTRSRDIPEANGEPPGQSVRRSVNEDRLQRALIRAQSVLGQQP